MTGGNPLVAKIAVDLIDTFEPADKKPFDCARDEMRDPRETKGRDYDRTTGACSGPECC